jgi:AGZA family xanthine/uracil permease-like MFS transporter
MKASGFAFAGAVLTFFGLMHGQQIGFAESPMVAASYVVVAVIMIGCAKFTIPVGHPQEAMQETELPGETTPA